MFSATTNAMMDALKRLLADREECCVFYKLIVGEEGPSILEQLEQPPESASPAPDGLNESQILAMSSWRMPLALIWGPPGTKISRRLISFLFGRCYCELGTGKTTVMVQILRDIIKSYSSGVPKILMTASTHNGMSFEQPYLRRNNLLAAFSCRQCFGALYQNKRRRRTAPRGASSTGRY